MIGGHVRDENGDPVDRAQVSIFKQVYRNGRKGWDRLNTNAETDDTGEYRFRGLRPGRYLLQARSTRPEIDNRYGEPPNAFYVPAYHRNATNRHSAMPVELGVGGEVRGADIHLARLTRPANVRVRGHVAGTPPGSQMLVSVGLSRADDAFFGGGGVTTGPPDYAFELNTPPGRYSIFAGVYSGGPPAYGTGTVDISGDITGVVVTMNPAPVIAGRFSLAESGPPVKLQGVRVGLIRHGDSSEYSASLVRRHGQIRFRESFPARPL